MRRPTYEAAWRLLEMIGDNRGPMLSGEVDPDRETAGAVS